MCDFNCFVSYLTFNLSRITVFELQIHSPPPPPVMVFPNLLITIIYLYFLMAVLIRSKIIIFCLLSSIITSDLNSVFFAVYGMRCSCGHTLHVCTCRPVCPNQNTHRHLSCVVIKSDRAWKRTERRRQGNEGGQLHAMK